MTNSKRNLQMFYAFTLGAVLAGHSYSEALQPPEQEVKAAITELKEINGRIESARKLYGHTDISTQNLRASKAFADAEESLQHKEYRATIHYHNQFLALSQTPQQEKYLKSQYQLGLAYEGLGERPKAVSAYIRYVGSFITNPARDTADLLDSLRRLLQLSDINTAEQNRNFGQLLAALSELKLEKNARDQVNFFLAYWAAYSQREKIADDWYSSLIGSQADNRLQAKALYYDGLIHIRGRNYDKARDNYNKIIELPAAGILDYRNLAYLSLARIAVHQKKENTALEYYIKVDPNSDIYPEALYERIILCLNTEQSPLAKKDAEEFLRRYSERKEAFQVRSLVSYIALKSEGLAEAKAAITDSDANLAKITHALMTEYAGKKSLEHSDVKYLQSLTGSWIGQPLAIEKSDELFSHIERINERMTDIRSDIRTTIFTLGRMDLGAIRPDWVNRNEQLSKYAFDILAVGHRLINLEKKYYDAAITPTQKVELAASEGRRADLNVPIVKIRREQGMWPRWVLLSQYNVETAEAYNKVKAEQSRLTGLLYSLRGNEKKKMVADRTAGLLRESVRVEKSLLRAMEIIRSRQVHTLLDQSFHSTLKLAIRDYANALYEESLVIAEHRDVQSSIGQRQFAGDATLAWQTWEQVLQNVYGQIDALGLEMEDTLQKRLSWLDTLVDRYDALAMSLEDTASRTKGNLGDHVGSILSYYQAQIDAQKARNLKWLADIEWVQYQKQVEDDAKATEKFELESQLLKEKLKDIEQGAVVR